jgi:hypothetical protein
MYTLMVVLLMGIFPLASIVIESVLLRSTSGLVFLTGKWFVFWAVGLRLLLAGLRQAITPQYTAEEILGIKSKEPFILVQELGFANLSIGLLGLSTLLNSTWIMPAALVGGLFYGLTGLRHILTKVRNRLENIAMISDLFIFIVLLAYFVLAVSHQYN